MSLSLVFLPHLQFYSFTVISSDGASFQPCHHPKHCPSSGNHPGHPGALLRPREHEPPQRPLPRSQQEHGAQGLSGHVCGYLRLSIGSQRLMMKDEEEEMYKSGIVMDRWVISRTADHKLMTPGLTPLFGTRSTCLFDNIHGFGPRLVCGASQRL